MNLFARLLQVAYALALVGVVVLLTTPGESRGQRYRNGFPGRPTGKPILSPWGGFGAAQAGMGGMTMGMSTGMNAGMAGQAQFGGGQFGGGQFGGGQFGGGGKGFQMAGGAAQGF